MEEKKMAIKELMTALAEFQKECPSIPREKEGYNYKYSSLDKIHEIIKPIMQKLGLVISQCVESEGNEQFTIKTILYHLDSGQKIESSFTSSIVSLKSMNDYQSLGSGITYMRRYTLSAILNLVSEEDRDAAGEQVRTKKKDERKWLNPADDSFKQAIDYLADDNDDHTMEDIEKKYKMVEPTRQQLIDAALDAIQTKNE